jgi:hypothetical protein
MLEQENSAGISQVILECNLRSDSMSFDDVLLFLLSFSPGFPAKELPHWQQHSCIRSNLHEVGGAIILHSELVELGQWNPQWKCLSHGR